MYFWIPISIGSDFHTSIIKKQWVFGYIYIKWWCYVCYQIFQLLFCNYWQYSFWGCPHNSSMNFNLKAQALFLFVLYTLCSWELRILFCISIENFIEILPLIYHGRSIYKPNFYYQQFYFVRSVISILFMMTNMPDWGFTSFTYIMNFIFTCSCSQQFLFMSEMWWHTSLLGMKIGLLF